MKLDEMRAMGRAKTEAVGWMHGARQHLDDLLEVALDKGSVWSDEKEREEVIRTAFIKALQCVRQAERSVDEMSDAAEGRR